LRRTLVRSDQKNNIMELQEISESKHKELLSLLNPLIDFMIENKYNYFLVAGKDGICTRHLRGDYDEVQGIIIGMIEKQKQVAGMLKDIVSNFKQTEK